MLLIGLSLCVCLVGFLTSSSTTRLSREWVPRLTSGNFKCCYTDRTRDPLTPSTRSRALYRLRVGLSSRRCEFHLPTVILGLKGAFDFRDRSPYSGFHFILISYNKTYCYLCDSFVKEEESYNKAKR